MMATGCDDQRDTANPRGSGARGGERTHKELTEHAARLATHYRVKAPDETAEERKCPDEELARAIEGGVGNLAIAEHGFLRRFAEESPDLYAGEGQRFKSLTTASLRVLRPPRNAKTASQATDALWNAQKFEREYTHLGVLWSRKRTGPSMQGDQLVSGTFQGVLVVFELGREKPLCQTQIEAGSSAGVTGVEGRAREDAIWNDFVSNVRTAIAAGVKRITARLNPDI